MQLKSEELHEKVARILGLGLVIERDRMHGGGFMVLGLDMKRCAGPFECEDLAQIALIRIQTDAILDLIFADRTELLANVERMRVALEAIVNESVFNQMRFEEDTDTDYFLRCFGAVKAKARAALTTGEGK